MQEEMIREQGLKPIEKEVAVVYEGEKEQHQKEFFEAFLKLFLSLLFYIMKLMAVIEFAG